MDNPTFTKAIEEQIERSEAVLVAKAKEYAAEGDRLHNFKQAAHLKEITQSEALSGMMVKHTVSIYDMLNAGDTTKYSLDQWNEKITDHINYLLLLAAVVRDDRATYEASLPQTISREAASHTVNDPSRYMRRPTPDGIIENPIQQAARMRRPIGDNNIENI